MRVACGWVAPSLAGSQFARTQGDTVGSVTVSACGAHVWGAALLVDGTVTSPIDYYTEGGESVGSVRVSCQRCCGPAHKAPRGEWRPPS